MPSCWENPTIQPTEIKRLPNLVPLRESLVFDQSLTLIELLELV